MDLKNYFEKMHPYVSILFLANFTSGMKTAKVLETMCYCLVVEETLVKIALIRRSHLTTY